MADGTPVSISEADIMKFCGKHSGQKIEQFVKSEEGMGMMAIVAVLIIICCCIYSCCSSSGGGGYYWYKRKPTQESN